MSEGKFYTPDEVKPLYGQIVSAYQEAFAGEPWYEASKCVDKMQRCEGGLSALQIGALCATCGNRPSKAAYEQRELESRFDALGSSRPTSWYVEQNEDGVTLAALAWSATADTIAVEKYADVPNMSDWLSNALGQEEIVWLDEVFANRRLRPNGNLQNFGKMVVGFASRLDCPVVAYRTKAPQMIKAAIRAFGDSATVSIRNIEVPDRRDFVVINPGKELK